MHMNYSQIMSPHPPLPRKVGGHDPPAPMGAPPLQGFNLPRQQWSLLNRFRTEQGHCCACRPAEKNSDLQTLICVLVARPRQHLTLSNPVP